MSFTLQVLRGSTSYTLSDGAPFSMEQGDDLGGASVRNIEESGPYQDGATHLDERLEPRTITLRLNVQATSDSLLDGYRDTLMTIFKPVRGVPITLKITRDDGAIRQIDCRRTGPLAISLVPMNRPGHLHRAVVQLRAADPTWYNPTEQNEDFAAPGQWWMALDTVNANNVLEHVESPGTAQRWTNATGVVAGSPWTIFFRSTRPGTASNQQFAFQSYNGTDLAQVFTNAFTDLAAVSLQAGGVVQGSVNALAAGTIDYFLQASGTAMSFYQGTVAFGPYASPPNNTGAIPGTAAGTARWRGDITAAANKIWPVAMPYAAAYNVNFSATQRTALVLAIAGSTLPASIAYTGDVDSYPVITITGPFANPVLTNTTTGDTLDFTGGTIGSADTWTIDTRYGRKSVLNAAGSSVANYLSNDSDLATFRIVPDPIAMGGTNVIALGGSAQGAGAGATLSYNARYLSF